MVSFATLHIAKSLKRANTQTKTCIGLQVPKGTDILRSKSIKT